MGSFLSLPGTNAQPSSQTEISSAESSKRLRMSSCYNDENQRLISNLPDEISLQILARLPRIWYLNVKMVSRSWKAAITSPEIYRLRNELGTTEEWLYILTKIGEDKLLWHALDPFSRKWQKLPPMPNIVYKEESKRVFSALRAWNVLGSTIKIADYIRSWLVRKDELDRLPFCGCTIGAVDGCLYVLGGFSRASAMRCVWKYDPCLNMWQEVMSMTTGRAYCKTGMLNGKLYVVGGVSRGRGGLAPLQSAEVYDPRTGLWTEVPSMPFSKAQVLPTAFLAEMLKPIATGMTSYRGRLYVPQSLYSWPFFVDVGGEIYDPETNTWAEMPAGMGEGWPARQAGTKLSVVVDGELYALDPSSTLDSGKIKIYDHQADAWKVVVEKVPIRDFTDAESPYLLAGFLGKLHVITKGTDNDIAILQAELPNHMCPQSMSSSPLASSLNENSSLPSSSSSLPSSLSLPPANSSNGKAMSLEEAEIDAWKVIASKNFEVAELVSCQVLNI
ncbi:F-box/kelch-repeat protein [Acorus calamus]|uniref:F-box/kelch-repeat protein n=1 Tax=Acorus calamus TaxID=4465 RepID=A0AAV9CNL8_ACOCL|nr:F-box/kelch-repeat protein [Acorus calamus]